MPNYAVYCPRPSVTAWALARALGVRRLREVTRVRDNTWTIFNFGSSRNPLWNHGVSFVNTPEAVRRSISKMDTYAALKEAGIKTAIWTQDVARARQWEADGHRVLTRKDGLSQGRGILIGIHEGLGDDWFYVRVFPKTHEFRVHVGGGKAIDFVEKKAVLSQVQVDRTIRSHQNGWVMAHSNLSVTQEDRAGLEDLAIRAVEALQLDFGAVDLLATLNKESPRRLSTARICEVNSAPGITSPTTFDRYLSYFNGLMEE